MAPRRATDRPAPPRDLPFVKVEGGGNDFVLVDARRGDPSAAAGISPVRFWTAARIRALLHRHRGVGGDGLLLIEADPAGTVARVHFWNPDGRIAGFCGNGARCVAWYLLESDGEEVPVAGEVEFRLGRVRLRGRRSSTGRYRVQVPAPRLLARPGARPPMPRAGNGAWIDAGVPHWIVPLADAQALEKFDLAAAAPALRRWEALGPAGTNVDLVASAEGEIRVRTYERGVEGETLACGSGLAAAGFWAAAAGLVPYPVRLRARGGDRFRFERDEVGRFWLEGPVRAVFTGQLPVRPASPRRE